MTYKRSLGKWNLSQAFVSGNLEIRSSNHGGSNLLTTTTTHPSQLVTPTWWNTQLCKWWIYAASTQPLILLFHLQELLLTIFPPSSSLFLLSWRSVLSALPIQDVDPSLCRGEVCDGCNLNFQPRLSVNWWSLAVWWNNHLFLVIWRLAVQTRRRQPTYHYYYASFTMQ